MADSKTDGSLSVHRRIRSFVLRAGRMTSAQQRGFDEGWSRWGVEYAPEPLDLDHLFGSTPELTAPETEKGERVLEIGFGMGQSLLEMAAARPQNQYLGVEVHRPGVGGLLHGIQTLRLSNIRVICHDAVEVLENCLHEASLHRIQIFFPDPWHKKKHHKRRLIQPEFARLLASRLAVDGVLHLATDWEPYAEHILEVLDGCDALQNCAGPGAYSVRPQERPLTKFEARGKRLGHGVWDLLYHRAPS